MIFDTSILILVPKLYRKGHTELVILFFKRTHAVRFYQKTIIFTMTSQSSCHYIHSTRCLTHGHPLLSPKNPCTLKKKSLYLVFWLPIQSFVHLSQGYSCLFRAEWGSRKVCSTQLHVKMNARHTDLTSRPSSIPVFPGQLYKHHYEC